MKKIVLIALLISVFGSVNAQSLDDLRQKAYEAAIEAVNKGKTQKSAYEEYLERQELEAAKKAEEEALEAKEAELDRQAEEEAEYQKACDTLAYCVFTEPMSKDVYVKVWFIPESTYKWYTIFLDEHNQTVVALYNDDNGEIGELYYASIIEGTEHIKAINDTTGITTMAIRAKMLTSYLIFIQDSLDPYRFMIAWED